MKGTEALQAVDGKARGAASCSLSREAGKARLSGSREASTHPLRAYFGGGGARTLRSPLCSGAETTPAASIASTRRAARL